MRPYKLFSILALISLVLLPVTPALAEEVTAGDLEEQLMCMCGCDLVLAACHCEQPDGAVEMRGLISEQLAQGEPQQEILGYFVAQYGAQVLAPPPVATTTPPPGQAPDLTLWVLALIGMLAGGVVIYQKRKKPIRRKKR